MSDSEKEFDLEITDVAYGGKGVGRHGGCVVFVPGALNGETVRVKVTVKKKKFMEAELIAVLDAAPQRVKPDCPLAGKCPGCSYRHVSYSEEVRIKQSQLEALLKRLASVDPAVCQEPFSSPESVNYRNKVVLHAHSSDTGKVLGYYGHDNRTILDVPCCPLAVKQINEKIAELRADSEFMDGLATGDRVGLRWTATDGVVNWCGSGEVPVLTEQTEVGPVRVPARGFFQVNQGVSTELLRMVKGMIDEIKPEYFVDMYCGVGVFALAAAGAGVKHVLGIDRSPPSIRCAERNAKQFEGVEFVCRDVEDTVAEAMDDLLPGKTAVVLDPPRQGLDKRVREALLKFCPQHIIYVSCAADTLARDIAEFTGRNYMLRNVRLLDMFPRTHLFETVALLERVN